MPALDRVRSAPVSSKFSFFCCATLFTRRCIEAVYKELKGVRKVVSGYAGGTLENPTYRVRVYTTGSRPTVREAQ